MTNDPVLTAMAAPDDGIDPPSRANPSSRASQIAALDIGESCCFTSGSFSSGLSLGEALASIPERTAALRNTVMSSVRQATARTGGQFTVEATEVITPQRNMYVVAIVTRME